MDGPCQGNRPRFNNQLTAILGYADMLLDQMGPDHPLGADLLEIKHAGERSAALTRQLLAFSRRQVLRIEPLALNLVVQEVSGLLRRLLGEDIVYELQLDADVRPIKGDAGQLAQVLSNLAVNARDAMPRGGRLTISTGSVQLTEEDARQRVEMQAGDYTVLEVSDTGHGMDAATQARIFEPFFTTKEVSKGTGLALSTVYGIVKQMGGFIWVYSEPGKGTRFRLYFPCTDESVRPKQLSTPAVIRPGHETVLVIEDEAGVRELALRALRRHGYTVLEAGSGEEARHVIEGRGGNIDLILVDVVLPGQSGPEVVAELQQRWSVKAVYMCGYSERHVQDHGRDQRVRLIEKPFTVQDLVRRVRKTLDDDAMR